MGVGHEMEPKKVEGERAITPARAALQEHVHRAFSGRKPDEVLPYFNFVRSNYEIAASGLFKWMFTAIASVIVFQLLTLAAIKDASFGPVTLQNLGVVQKALPVFIAYSMYRSAVFGAMWKMYDRAHQAFLAEIEPKLIENDLERYVRPAHVLLFRGWAMETAVRGEGAYRSVTRKLTFAVATGILIFEVYAFYRLFETYGADDFGTWLALTATLPLLGLYRWVDLSFSPLFSRRLDAVHRASGCNGDNTDAD
jgi:hypothetical protein